ncbi:MAG: TMEM43 family protein [Rhizobiaceae bacterium]
MSDIVRESTSVSWLGRLKRSLGGFVAGLVLVLAMVVLLFWNEGRAVTTARSLTEGAGIVVSVEAGRVEPANEGALIHVAGDMTSATVPSDDGFAVSAPGIRLVRTVEMYQWKETARSETKTRLGGGEETVTTYSYAKEWDSRPIESGDFRQPAGHANPPMEISSRTVQVPEARLGGFVLGAPVLDRVGGAVPLPVPAERRDPIDAAYDGTQRVSVVDGRIYLGWNPASPSVGDYRISYQAVPLGAVSIVGRQTGHTLAPYQTEAGSRLLMVERGSVPPAQMFAQAQSANVAVTWVLRIAGLVVLAIAFALVLGPLGVLADVVPVFGSLVRLGTGLVGTVLAIMVGATAIALAWFWYRPLLSFGILAGAALLTILLTLYGRSRKAGPESARPAATAGT